MALLPKLRFVRLVRPVEDVRVQRFDGIVAEAEAFQIGEAVEDVRVERF